jgi:hypothetical protein
MILQYLFPNLLLVLIQAYHNLLGELGIYSKSVFVHPPPPDTSIIQTFDKSAYESSRPARSLQWLREQALASVKVANTPRITVPHSM